jgi:myb proto-oncogene protein
MDDDGGAGACVEAAQAPWTNAAPYNGDGTEASAGTTDDWKEWWLEDLERELGLWGPVEDYQYQALSGLVGRPSASVDDSVSCYFEAGPGT